MVVLHDHELICASVGGDRSGGACQAEHNHNGESTWRSMFYRMLHLTAPSRTAEGSAAFARWNARLLSTFQRTGVPAQPSRFIPSEVSEERPIELPRIEFLDTRLRVGQCAQ
jgi:hypothetical protein